MDREPFENTPKVDLDIYLVYFRGIISIPDAFLSIWSENVKNSGAERYGTHRGAFEKNKKKIFATQTVCGICGKPVDFGVKYPHPLSPCIDHIIPIAKGGHPSDIDNMQLAHWTCNRQKSDKLIEKKGISSEEEDIISNRILPLTIDWTAYRG